MKRILTALLLMLAAYSAAGQDKPYPLVRYGLEWAGSVKLIDSHHFNYISSEAGYRIDDENISFKPSVNGLILASISLNLTRKLSMGIYSGFQGISEKQRIVPVFLRTAYSFKGCDKDGVFTFCDLGAGLRHLSLENRVMMARIGSGYRVVFSRNTAFSMLLSIQAADDKPIIWDKYAEEYVSTQNTRLNTAGYLAVNFGIALDF